jgi:4-carboxymuconolactone decarboxylase
MDHEALERGLRLRRQVLGAAYADASLEERGVSAKLHRMVIQFGWGEAWSGEYLPLKTRSLLMVAMLTALGRPEQLRIHFQGALNNGATPDELMEVLMHAAVVCGAPAALDASKIAEEVFDSTAPV